MPTIKLALRSEYKRLCAKGWSAKEAKRAAEVKAKFDALASLGFVKLECEPDEYADLDNVLCACGEEGCEEEHRAPERRKAERDGIWGLVGYFRVRETDKWTVADSVWGFVGESGLDSGYDTDIRRSTMDALDDAWEKEARELAERATFAGVTE